MLQGIRCGTELGGGPNNDEGYSMIQTSDGGYMIVGHTRSFGFGTAPLQALTGI